MGYVKLDECILASSLWDDVDARGIFLTAILLARPKTITRAAPAIQVRTLEGAGWSVPPGPYGFVEASGAGLILMSRLTRDVGMDALERLCGPDPDSKDPDYAGRRMARVSGGYIVLNYDKYREKDHTATERKRRQREREREEGHGRSRRDHVTLRDKSVTVTEADADADADADLVPPSGECPPAAEPKASREREVMLEVQSAWNALAADCGLVQCRAISGGRARALRARIREPDWRRDYVAGLERLRGIQWIRGSGGYRPRGIDWFLQPDTLTKILEGQHDDNRRQLAITSPDDSAGLF